MQIDNQKLQALLDQACREGEEYGCQLAIYHHGNLVADLNAGKVAPTGKEVASDTLFPVFSAGKGIVSTKSTDFNRPSLHNIILSFFVCILQPFSRNLCKSAAIFSVKTPSTSISPPQEAAALRYVPASIRSPIGV